MSNGLNVNDVVNVSVSIAPTAAPTRNFGNLLILGSSQVIDVSQRLRLYASLAAIGADFGQSASEYAAAALYFSQSPTPAQVYIGAWAYAATHALLHGGTLTTAQQQPSAWTPITAGGFNITVDGVAKTVTGLNFSSVTNMNAVAAVINAAISAWGTCTWNAVYSRLEIVDNSTGAGVAASGTATFSGQPTANDTLTIAGTAITFVASGATGNQVNIGASLTATLANLLAFLQASADSNLVKCTYGVSGSVLTVTSVSLIAATGNALTLAKSSTAITLSGATLAGGVSPSTLTYASTGSGTDISAQAGLTAASGALTPINGIAAESCVSAINTIATLSNDWYGLYIASANAQVSDYLAAAAFVEVATPSRILGVSTQDSNVLSATATSDIAYQLQQLNYKRTYTQYSSSSPYAAISIFGAAFTVNFLGQNTTITVKFKTEPGVAAETLTEAQAAAAKAKNCNVFVNYDNSTAIVQEGVMAGGYFFDETQGLDWLQNQIQTAVYNLLYNSTTKIPQTDAGVNQIVAAVTQSLDQGVQNGLLAPGVWTGPALGPIANGQTLIKGYFVFAPPISTQSLSARAARQSPTIQVAAKLAGAIHFANVVVSANR